MPVTNRQTQVIGYLDGASTARAANGRQIDAVSRQTISIDGVPLDFPIRLPVPPGMSVGEILAFKEQRRPLKIDFKYRFALATTGRINADAFNFYGHGTSLYALAMCLAFTGGKLLPRTRMTAAGIPVTDGERGNMASTDYVSASNYGRSRVGESCSTDTNRWYADQVRHRKLMTDDDYFHDRVFLNKDIQQDWHPGRHDFIERDCNQLSHFRETLQSDRELELIFETLSRIPVVLFGDGVPDDDPKNRERCIELGTALDINVRFATCDEKHLPAVRRLISDSGLAIQVHSNAVLDQIDKEKNLLARRNKFVAWSTPPPAGLP